MQTIADAKIVLTAAIILRLGLLMGPAAVAAEKAIAVAQGAGATGAARSQVREAAGPVETKLAWRLVRPADP